MYIRPDADRYDADRLPKDAFTRITILHNEQHNVETDKEFIYYTHNQIHYKVPTTVESIR
jgi:flagellar basal body rod protein FlgB